MRPTIPTLVLGLTLAGVYGAALAPNAALAQGTSDTTVRTPADRTTPSTAMGPNTTVPVATLPPGDRPYTPNNPPPQPEQKTDWGWVGLLGLVGLAGLMPKRREVTTTTTTGVAPDGTVRRK